MKKLLLILLLFICVRSFSQGGFPINVTQGGVKNTVLTKGVHAVDSGFWYRTNFIDTATANLGQVKYQPGIVIRAGNTLWMRNSTATAWIILGGAGSGGTITDIDILNDSTWIVCYSDGSCDTTTIEGGGGYSILNIYNNSVVNVTIANDTCLVRHTGGELTDTACSNIHITSWEAIDCSTFVVHGYIPPDTLTMVSDTLIFGTCIPLYIYQNWLRQPSAGVYEFGSDQPGTSPGLMLGHPTYVNTNYFQMNFGGYAVYRPSYEFWQQQSFQNSTGIVSYLHNGDPANTGVENRVRLYINYSDSFRTAGVEGYFGTARGYSISPNWQGHGSFGTYLDNNNSKTTGIFFHTYDSSNTDGVTIYAAPDLGGTAPVMNGQLKNYKNITASTDGRNKFNRYTLSNFLNVDSTTTKPLTIDANGNITTGYWFGGGGGANIYNTSDTLTGNRILGGGNLFKTLKFEKLGRFDVEIDDGDTYWTLDNTYSALAIYNPNGVGITYHDMTSNDDESFHQIGASNKVDLYLGNRRYERGAYWNLDVQIYGHLQRFNIDSSGFLSEPEGGNYRIDSLVAGAITDSLMSWNKTTGAVRYLNVNRFASTTYVDSIINTLTILTKNTPGNGSAKAISFIDNDTLELKGMGDGLYTTVTTRSDSANLVNIDTAAAGLHTFIANYSPRTQLAYAGINGNGTDLIWLDTIHHRVRFKDTTNNFNYGIAIFDSIDATDYDVDAQIYIDAVNATDVTLTTPQKVAINDYVLGLKSDGLWSLIYDQGFPIWGTANSSAVNLKVLNTTSWVNSPTFGSTGVTGNGSSMYGNLNFAPDDAFSSADDAHVAVYIQDNQTDVNYADIGVVNSAATSAVRINSKANSATSSYLNHLTGGASTATVASSAGFTLINRTSSSNIDTYKNGGSASSAGGLTSGGLGTDNIFILASNQLGSPGIYSARTMSMWSVGARLTGTQAGNLATRVNAFMTALSINVY